MLTISRILSSRLRWNGDFSHRNTGRKQPIIMVEYHVVSVVSSRAIARYRVYWKSFFGPQMNVYVEEIVLGYAAEFVVNSCKTQREMVVLVVLC